MNAENLHAEMKTVMDVSSDRLFLLEFTDVTIDDSVSDVTLSNDIKKTKKLLYTPF